MRKQVRQESFREALSTVPGPVTVVTAGDERRAHATTVSAFCSLSAEPPLVLVALDRASRLLDVIRGTGRFAVHLLRPGQEHVALHCSRKGPDKLRGIAWRLRDGLPSIDGGGTWIACTVDRLVPAGDHVIVIGLVEQCDPVPSSALVYHRRSFHHLPLAADA